MAQLTECQSWPTRSPPRELAARLDLAHGGPPLESLSGGARLAFAPTACVVGPAGWGSDRVQRMKTEAALKTYNKLELLKLMYLSREGDRREGVLHRQSKGWFQVAGMGHETLAVVALQMQPGDFLFPYYRDRAMVLARGMTNAELARAYFAKRDTGSGGRQMPGHYSCRRRGIWSVPTPTGANAIPACGVAWSMQLRGLPHVAVATLGDAASRQGEFYEAIAFSVERQLPLILLVEDNQYGISTNTLKFNPFRLGLFDEGIGLVHVDARHPDRVSDAITPALAAPARDKARRSWSASSIDCAATPAATTSASTGRKPSSTRWNSVTRSPFWPTN